MVYSFSVSLYLLLLDYFSCAFPSSLVLLWAFSSLDTLPTTNTLSSFRQLEPPLLFLYIIHICAIPTGHLVVSNIAGYMTV